MIEKDENPKEYARSKMIQPPDYWQPKTMAERNKDRAVKLLEVVLDLLTDDDPHPHPYPPWPTPFHGQKNADGDPLRTAAPGPPEDQTNADAETAPATRKAEGVHLGKEDDWS